MHYELIDYVKQHEAKDCCTLKSELAADKGMNSVPMGFTNVTTRLYYLY